MRRLELLAPAKDYDVAIAAINHGADAGYIGAEGFGARSAACNSITDIARVVDYAHQFGVRVYVTFNTLIYDEELSHAEAMICQLYRIGVDALIIQDLGILRMDIPPIELHASTQCDIRSAEKAVFLQSLGFSQMVLARELNKAEIEDIRSKTTVRLEAFVHGAMCISYSGRCLLSNFLTNRDGNKGACVQACRWKYTINEVSRTNEKLPIMEDERGTYILNSKDLNMIEHLDDLVKAGVTSFKIEGRMKTSYYVATVTNAYKRALNDYLSKKEFNHKLLLELDKASNRGYTTGFYYKDKMDEKSERLDSSAPSQTYEYMAIVLESKNGEVSVEQRNNFKVGDTLEILSPGDSFNKSFIVKKMKNEKGEEVETAKIVQEKLILNCPFELHKGDILRKKVE